AIAVQKRVVEGGWDPAPDRGAAGDGAVTSTVESIAAPGGENAPVSSSRGRIPRPAGAPLPPSRQDLGL
ncbi:PTS system ascorbate-specific transporter subunit IIC, partial [Cutibacterium granulosum DSM 20700]